MATIACVRGDIFCAFRQIAPGFLAHENNERGLKR